MKKLIKISLANIIFLAILTTNTFALTGIVNAPSGLVLREEASKTSNPIRTIEDKTEVNIIEKNEEWYKILYNSQEGYLFAEYVEVEEVEEEKPLTENTENTQAKGKLKVYNIPLITSTVINEIDAEEKITVIKEITNWSYVSTGKIQGWIRTYGIKGEVENQNPEEPIEKEPEVNEEKEEPSEPTISEIEDEPTYDEPSNETQTETPSTVKKGFVAVDSATVRAEPTTNSAVVTYLIKDTSFTIKAETEEWYKMEYTGIDGTIYEGYIYKQLVTI